MPTNQQIEHRLSRHWLALATALFALAVAGCGSEKRPDADPVAIEVGERTIRLSELQAQIDFLDSKNAPMASDQEAFIEDYVQRSITLAKARELGLDQDVELQRQMENLLIGRLKQTQLDQALASVSVTDAELQEYYEANLDKYGRPAQSRLALLHLPTDRFMDAATRQAVADRLQEAKELSADLPADTRGFGSLAMKYSEEPTSRFKGGDIGWMQSGKERYRWPEPVVEAAFALEVGEVGEVIETDTGYYLLKKTDARSAVVPPLEGRFAASLSHTLLREKREALAESFEKEWAQGIALELHKEVLAQLEFSTPTIEPSRTTEVTRSLP